MSRMIQPPPTSCLPPITTIAACSGAQLLDALKCLHALYLPSVRGSRRRRQRDDHDHVPDGSERAYAIRWLTALIAKLQARPTSTDIDADLLIEQAASVLAACAGVAAAGRVQRRFTFESSLAREIHVTLTDIPLNNHDYASVGAQTWGGACVLAELIAEHPDRFGLGLRSPSRALRVLELGAGTGLVGLTVAKLLQASSPRPHRATIVLTDFYPPVLDNLQSNIDINVTDHTICVSSHFLDWASFSSMQSMPDVLSTPFDVVFGADIVYEAQHAVWIRDCLQFLLADPDGSNEEPVFHLIIPLRPTHTFESSTIEGVFGSNDPVSQRALTILSKKSIVCEAYGDGGSDRNRKDDEVEYVYYQIGWKQ